MIWPILFWAMCGLVSFFILWLLFLAVMNIDQARSEGKLPRDLVVPAYTALAIGYLVDFVVQVTFASVLWLELPRELTVSERVARLYREGHGYRLTLALWFRRVLLAPFDRSGGHG